MPKCKYIEIIERANKNKETSLNLSKKKIKNLTPEICKLTDITELDISRNQIRFLPPEIGKLSNLTKLYLNDNQLEKLPPEIGLLKNLKELDISRNKLSGLPEEISKLSSLTILDLSRNQLKKLPEIGNLSKLIKLDLSRNEISKLPIKIGDLKNLLYLILDDNLLVNLPIQISNLINLKVLSANFNRLTKIPHEIRNLKQLNELHINSNKLVKLPSEIGNLESLRRLYIRNNELINLPPEIGNLANLENLDLRENKFSNLPNEISQLERLSVLDLDNNPITTPDSETIQNGVYAIKEYLATHEHQDRIIYEGKIIILGNVGVGKSSLLTRLIYNNYSEEIEATNSISTEKWQFVITDNQERNKIKLNILDFNSDEINNEIYQFYMSKRTLYILVLNNKTESENKDIYYWINNFHDFANDSTLIIVLNNFDDTNKTLNLENLKNQLPKKEKEIYEINCKNGEGIDNLKRAIKKSILKLPLIKDKWPANWLTIKKTLETEKKNYMLFTNFSEVCGRNNITKNEEQIIAQTLNDIGVITYFKEDFTLLFLKREWLTNAISEILNAKFIKERNGILFKKDLSFIFRDKVLYPIQIHDSILGLMKNHSFLIPIGENGEKYIVRNLISKEGIDYSWNDENNFYLEYHYEFLPKYIMIKFIASIDDYIIKKNNINLCWREGALIEKVNTRALAKIFNTENKIEIKIEGKEKEILLAIIDDHFYRIHQKYEIKVTKRLIKMQNSGVDFLRLLRVFLCHSSEDKTLVRSLYWRLRNEQNVDPWIDEEKIIPGQDFDLEIKKTMRESDIVIICLSKESIKKEGYVNKEMKFAINISDEKPEGTIFLIPLKLEKIDEFEIPERLRHLHWVNYYDKTGYNELINSLKLRMKQLNLYMKK